MGAEDLRHLGTPQERFGHSRPDVICVLSGSVTNRNGSSDQLVLRPTGFWDNDARDTLSWGAIRLLATQQRATTHPSVPILTLTTSTNTPEGYSDASVMADALSGRRVANPIWQVPQPLDTMTELLNIVDFALKHEATNLDIVTTGFQAHRAQAMLTSIQNIDEGREVTKLLRAIDSLRQRFPERGGDIEQAYNLFEGFRDVPRRVHKLRAAFVVSEDVVAAKSSKHRKIVEGYKMEPRYQEKVSMDIQGANDWEAGRYGLRMIQPDDAQGMAA